MPPFVVACHAKHVEDAENVNASVTRTAPTCVHLLFHVRGECCAPTPDASRRGGLSLFQRKCGFENETPTKFY